jgi:hypothetical protein
MTEKEIKEELENVEIEVLKLRNRLKNLQQNIQNIGKTSPTSVI